MASGRTGWRTHGLDQERSGRHRRLAGAIRTSLIKPLTNQRDRDNPAKHFLVAFAIALVLYVATYGWIQHLRNRKGPWRVSFTNTNGAPALIINQASLGLTN